MGYIVYKQYILVLSKSIYKEYVLVLSKIMYEEYIKDEFQRSYSVYARMAVGLSGPNLGPLTLVFRIWAGG